MTNEAEDTSRDVIRTEQIKAVTRLTPWMMLGNVINASFLVHQGWGSDNKVILVLWAAALYLFAIMTVITWTRFKRRSDGHRASARVIRRAAMHAGLLGLLWGVAPMVLYVTSSIHEQVAIVVVVGGTMAAGAFALAVIPLAAYSFMCGIVVPFAGGLLVASTEKFGPIAFVVGLFAATVALIISHTYQRFMRHLEARSDMRRQSQIIGLLLKDFEESSSDWLWEADANGRLAYISDRYLKLVGKKREELIGQVLCSVPGGKPLTGWEEIKECRENHIAYSNKIVSVEIDGEERWWSMTGKPMFDEGSDFEGFRGVGADVTNSRRATDALKAAKDAAEHANAAKSQFLAMISHELRTPLNAIIGFSDLISSQCHGPIGADDYVEHARDINESGRHLLTIINDLLDLARIDSNQFQLNPSTFEIGEVIDSVVRITSLAANKKSITVDLKGLDDMLLIRGDFGRMRQVVINLIFNAIKFTPENGCISVGTNVEEGMINLTICDTGPGIPDGFEEKLFEPFRQADDKLSREAGGVGLGLPIARKLAEAHGGTVKLSNGDAGAIALLQVPYFDEEAAEAEADAEFERVEAKAIAQREANENETAELTEEVA